MYTARVALKIPRLHRATPEMAMVALPVIPVHRAMEMVTEMVPHLHHHPASVFPLTTIWSHYFSQELFWGRIKSMQWKNKPDFRLQQQ